MEFTHTRLLVDNYKECFLFYRDVLGFNVSWGDENSNYADFKFNGATLGVFDRKQMIKAIGGDYSTDIEKVDRTALIFSVESVEESYQALKNKVNFITKPTEQKNWGIKVAHFRDPAGSLIEIYESIEMSTEF
ncbi:VOC family protein [Oceanobacillus profundus]|uniref:VOC family protein n=1 Tax=Oceanobacillus profundus TaxID=372463 RepID=A0A417YA11_9BACI|nr:VOC family protein [Oceanobacillus profundus]MCM3397945.1 VOC family protein [Oceanobacillus profundus]PAE27441.1 bleomycin resistance protein [Paenibacillus sp. 7884-2]RHW29523.1 VOC family protein [Oceanobacillus profundus]